MQDSSNAPPPESPTHDESDIEKRLQASAEVLDEIMKAPDKGIPQEILDSAKCIAVVPSMVKFAIGFGGHYGKGVATCRTSKRTWSAPAPIFLTGGSWGLQFGGQAVDLVMLIMNQKGMDTCFPANSRSAQMLLLRPDQWGAMLRLLPIGRCRQKY